MGDMRIMLVDDNGDLRRGMRDYLARQEGMKVVADARPVRRRSKRWARCAWT